MEATQAGTLTLATGAVVLTLYNRGVVTDFFAALRGAPPKPFTSAGAIGAGSGSGTSPGGGASLPGGASSDALTAIEAQVTAGGAPGGGGDWLDWCLQWADQVRQKLGLKTFYGYGTAGDACGSVALQKGPAPRGSMVCVGSNHVGISNGGCTYTSVGIYHGGPVTLDYCNNPNYRGYVA